DDQREPKVDVMVKDAQGATDDRCTYRLSHVDRTTFQGYEDYSLVFWKPGRYTVVATPRDSYNALGSPSSLEVTVVDATPIFAAGSTPTLRTGSADACGAQHTAARPVLIVLDDDPTDPEANAEQAPQGCADISPGL